MLYTADDPADLELVTRDTYLDDWVQVVEQLGPRYGVPFGSMVAFLHPDSCSAQRAAGRAERGRRRVPQAATALDHRGGADGPGRQLELRRRLRARRASTGTPTAPSTSTSSPRRWRRRSRRRPRPRKASPSTTRPSPTTSTASCTRSRPACSASFALRRPVVFEVPSSPLPFWVLDFKRRAVYRLSSPPPDTASIVTVNEAVLADAIAKRLVHVVHGSMRIRVHLRAGGAGDDLTFWGLVVPWELGLPAVAPVPAPAPRRGHVAPARRMARVGRRGARRGRHAVRAHLRPARLRRRERDHGRRRRVTAAWTLMAGPKSFFLTPEIHEYVVTHGTPPDAVQQALIDETAELPMAMMQISPEQGTFMTLITRLHRRAAGRRGRDVHRVLGALDRPRPPRRRPPPLLRRERGVDHHRRSARGRARASTTRSSCGSRPPPTRCARCPTRSTSTSRSSTPTSPRTPCTTRSCCGGCGPTG